MLVYLNGAFLPKEEAKISVNDRGFLFGDGVYEVTRAVRGRLFEEERHWNRLQFGLRELGIGQDAIARDTLREVSERLLAENGLADADATVYLQITRGVAPRAHAYPKPAPPPTIYASASPFTIPGELRRTGVSAVTVPDIRWSRCDIKTVNLLPNVVARQRAVEAGAWEAVLVRDGAITEGAVTSVFGVIDGELRTYPRSNYILPGVTRDVILELARENGIPTRETPIYWEQIGQLQELFLTGTTTDVQAIVRLDGRPVGDGSVGPITRALHAALMRKMDLPDALAAA